MDNSCLSDIDNRRLDEIVFSLINLEGASTVTSVHALTNLIEAVRRNYEGRLESSGTTKTIETETQSFIEQYGCDPMDKVKFGVLNDLLREREIWSPMVPGNVAAYIENDNKFWAAFNNTPSGANRSAQIAEKLGVVLKDNDDEACWCFFIAIHDFRDRKNKLTREISYHEDKDLEMDIKDARAKSGLEFQSRLITAISLIAEGRELALQPYRPTLPESLQAIQVVDLERIINPSRFIKGDEKTVFDGLTTIHQAMAKPLKGTYENFLNMAGRTDSSLLNITIDVADQFDAALNPIRDLVMARLRRQSAQGNAANTTEHPRGRVERDALVAGQRTDPSGGKETQGRV
jgi:hypothetical protein